MYPNPQLKKPLSGEAIAGIVIAVIVVFLL